MSLETKDFRYILCNLHLGNTWTCSFWNLVISFLLIYKLQVFSEMLLLADGILVKPFTGSCFLINWLCFIKLVHIVLFFLYWWVDANHVPVFWTLHLLCEIGAVDSLPDLIYLTAKWVRYLSKFFDPSGRAWYGYDLTELIYLTMKIWVI